MTNIRNEQRNNRMKAWKIYGKISGVHVDTVWYDSRAEADEVHALESEEFDFDILVKEVEAD
jgi:hypothetical protein